MNTPTTSDSTKMSISPAPRTPRKSGSNKMTLARKRKAQTSSKVYIPSILKLKRDFDNEFKRFLTTLKVEIDAIEDNKQRFLLPLEKQLRKSGAKSRKLQLHFQSMIYWKNFFTEFINKCDDIIELFRLDDIRDIDEAVKEANISEILIPFVKDNLMCWRKTFESKTWMVEFKRNTEEMARLDREMNEEESRNNALNNILANFEKYGIDMDSMPDFESAEEMENWMTEKYEHVRKATNAQKVANEIAEQLKNLPSVSKSLKTREWCTKHHDNSFELGTQSDELSSSGGKSSLIGEDGDLSSDLSCSDDGEQSESNAPPQQEDGLNSFFSQFGL